MKLKLQGRPLAAEGARKVEHVLRKAAGNAWSQPEERRHVAVRPANGKARDVGLPKAVGAHIRTPCVLMSGTELKIVFCADFSLFSHTFLLGWVCLHCAIKCQEYVHFKGSHS